MHGDKLRILFNCASIMILIQNIYLDCCFFFISLCRFFLILPNFMWTVHFSCRLVATGIKERDEKIKRRRRRNSKKWGHVDSDVAYIKFNNKFKFCCCLYWIQRIQGKEIWSSLNDCRRTDLFLLIFNILLKKA